MNILIIEDEPLAQEELERMIKKHLPHDKIVGKIDSVDNSIQWFSENEADLIFMDIQLSDGICFDIFKQVDVHTPIIFTTAYDQYAINAFKVNGIGYLLKPIVEEEFVNTIKKLEHTPLHLKKLLAYLKPSKEYKTRIMVKNGERFGFLPIESIAYFFAEERVTFAMAKDGKRHLVDYTIESLEPLLDPKTFFKITRGCIASIDSIEKVTKHFNSRLKISLSPAHKEDLLISRIRVPEFIKWLDGE